MVDRKYTTRPGPAAPAEDNEAWFAPKLFGLGSGLPIRWQGWAVYGAYLVALVPIGLLDRLRGAVARDAAFVLFAVATLALLHITRKRTRGGWKWRWGAE